MSFKLFMLLVQACGWTLVISSVSIVAGLALGTVVSACMQSGHRVLSLSGRTFVSFFRGAPLLVQLLLIYNLLPMLGLSPLQQFWRIRAPIALRMTLPALTNEAIMILKASSLVLVVGVIELTRTAQDLSASTFKPLPLFAAAALLYLVINSVVAYGAHRLEGSFRWGVKA